MVESTSAASTSTSTSSTPLPPLPRSSSSSITQTAASIQTLLSIMLIVLISCTTEVIAFSTSPAGSPSFVSKLANSNSIIKPSPSLSPKRTFASNALAFATDSNNDSQNVDLDVNVNVNVYEQRVQRKKKKNILQERKRDWINRSLSYYSTVSREAKRRENGQYVPSQIELDQYKSNFITAKKLYFARHKIKKNQPRHAERIYRKLIDDLLREQEEEGSCDNAQIAISTLLLALLLQRQGEVKETRATFIKFFRLITMNGGEFKECTCSAKVLQAFALFEMKQKNVKKAYALIKFAVKLDSELEPVLHWKQFRDAKKLIQSGSRRLNTNS